jgi:hypothetical protein
VPLGPRFFKGNRIFYREILAAMNDWDGSRRKDLLKHSCFKISGFHKFSWQNKSKMGCPKKLSSLFDIWRCLLRRRRRSGYLLAVA